MNAVNSVQLQPAYILHTRAFRESSLLLEVFTLDYGRVSLVARGARSSASSQKKLRFSSSLQPFVPLLLSWSGRGSLFNLTHAESNGIPPLVNGSLLKSGWYMNELLVRTLGHWDANTELFLSYQTALYTLFDNLIVSLRFFEKNLLHVLGVFPQLDYEKDTKNAVQRNGWYLFSPLEGVTRANSQFLNLPNCFSGAALLAAKQNIFEDHAYSTSIKRLFRLMFNEVLSHQAIRSRDLL